MKKIFLSLIPLFLTFTLSAQEQKKLTITPLTKNCFVYTTYMLLGENYFPSNSMYIVTDSGVVLIDTPWDTTQILPLLDLIEKRHNKKVVMCISTHSHDDRTAGIDILKSRRVKTFSSAQTQEICKKKNEKAPEFSFQNDTIFQIGKQKFLAYYPGEGHTKDNIVIWLPKEKILFGGCLVKSTESFGLGNIADANISAWPASIKNLIKKFPRAKFIIPGHQSWKNKNSLKHTLRLLRDYQENR